VAELLDRLREGCASVAERATRVRIDHDALSAYAATLPPVSPREQGGRGSREHRAAFWLTLDAVNFGSGWFPTLRKAPGATGYSTIAGGLERRFEEHGAWSADELAQIDPAELAAVLGQDPGHELVGLFADSLNDLGRHVADEYDGSFERVVGASAQSLVELLAGWSCFADTSRYEELELPFLKRAQLAAADLARSGAAEFKDLDRLTMFADNLVPHVLRLDGVLRFDPELVARIDREQLIEHGSPEEVEIRACAVHAVELIVTEMPAGTTAAGVDQLLWNRGQAPRYKASPRHRARSTAY
jgi:Queuosine salvage protein